MPEKLRIFLKEASALSVDDKSPLSRRIFVKLSLMLCAVTGISSLPGCGDSSSDDGDNGDNGSTLTVPSGLTATALSATSIALMWNSTDTDASLKAASSAGGGYKIYRDGVFLDITTETSYTDIGLSSDTMYCYQVLAYDDGGEESGLSAQSCATTEAVSADFSGPPLAPTNLTVVAVSGKSVYITWTGSGSSSLKNKDFLKQGLGKAAESCPVTYNIYRDGAYIGNTSDTWYYDNTAEPGETYSYTVTAVDCNGRESDATGLVNVTTPDDNTTCCLPAGTRISTPSGYVLIEDIRAGDTVLSMDIETGGILEAQVGDTVSPVREAICLINGGLLGVTTEHPVYVEKADGRSGWASLEPRKTEAGYEMDGILELETGDMLMKIEPVGQGGTMTVVRTMVAVESLELREGPIQTYNLLNVSEHGVFIANGLVTHNMVAVNRCGAPP